MSMVASGLITARRRRLVQTTCPRTRGTRLQASTSFRSGDGFAPNSADLACRNGSARRPKTRSRLSTRCALRELRSQPRSSRFPSAARRAPVSAVPALLALGRPARCTSRAGLTSRLSGTANGVPPGPRSRLCNHRLRGPGVTPSAAA